MVVVWKAKGSEWYREVLLGRGSSKSTVGRSRPVIGLGFGFASQACFSFRLGVRGAIKEIGDGVGECMRKGTEQVPEELKWH